ncbi:MAG: GNAT family N-acetyltransferase [Bosea sp. (in: a-proteobacteria)]
MREAEDGPQPALRVADMTLDNWRVVVDLWVEAWAKTMPHIDFEARRKWLISQRATYSRDGTRVRVALDRISGNVKGAITLRPRDGYIDQLVVGSGDWGQGIGQALVSDAKRLSPRMLYLFVNQANERAVTFYEKIGFRRMAESVNADSGLPTWRYEWAG